MKQRTIKYFSLLATITLLPFANFGSVYQVFTSGKVTPTSLKQAASKISALPSALADTPTAGMTTPTSAFVGKSISVPAQTPLPTWNVTDAQSGFGYSENLAGNANVGSNKLVVLGSDGTLIYANTMVSDANIQAALTALNTSGSSATDYILLIAGNVTLSATTMANTGAAGTFSGLKGHAKSLTIQTSTTDQVSDAATITSASSNYFGVPTVLRNAKIAGANSFYFNGNAFELSSNADLTANATLYGGSDGTTDVSGDTNIYIGSVPSGTLSIYGGNKSGGTITGSTHVTINAGKNFTMLSGGNASGGTVNGDTNLNVTNFGGSVAGIDGGGVGTSSAPVTVKGNVYNNISSTNSAATYNGTFYGGGAYATITGAIYNNFAGLGKYNGEEMYNGGVMNGSVGTSGNVGTAIVNNYDTSQFSGSYANFAGIAGANNAGSSNSNPVVVYGNVTNYVKTGYGTSSTSWLGGVVGAYGSDYLNNTKMPAATSSNDADPNGAAAKAEAAASEKLYGNAYTWIKGGLVGSGYDYNIVAGGGYGFIKGQTIMEVGDGSTAPGGVAGDPRSATNRTGVGGSGFVMVEDQTSSTSSHASTYATNGLSYSTSTNQGGQYGANDIVGGGGNDAGNGSNYWQVGDSYLIQNNSIARWTYGGDWSGSQVGNSYNINNGSIVDTLEGSSYSNNTRCYGSTASQINNGQVDWFFSGGGWNTGYISGNMSTYAYNGIINANTGGNYALTSSDVTVGDSSVYLYGGDFSASPRQDGPKTVCGANFESGGTVKGNSSLTLDLTGPTGSTFKFPTGANTNISASAGYNTSGAVTGTDSSNTVNLTIKANSDTADKLASATIYGDGAKSGTNAGTINILIDAEGAKVGNVYASNQSMVSSGKITRNVNTTIGEGTTIVGNVYNSASSDDYTSAVATASTNQSTLTLGDGSAAISEPITITGKVANFTTVTVNAGVDATVAGGLLNGAKATAANHAGTYAKSGTLTLNDKSTLGVTSTNSVISASKLTVNGNVDITSPYTNTVGLMNFSDLAMNGQLTWLPTGTPIAPTNSYTGAYWGAQKGYPVLTFNGGDSTTNSGVKSYSSIDLFKAIDVVNNYAFLGDYTTSSQSSPTNPTWFIYAVPGNIRKFTIDDPEATMVGQWWHNLANVSNDPTPGGVPAGDAYADVNSSGPSSTMTIMYPQSYVASLTSGNTKAFSFDCDDSFTGGTYVKSRVVTKYDGSVQDSYPEYSPDYDFSTGQASGAVQKFDTSDYFTGSNKDGSYPSGAVSGSYLLTTITETTDSEVSQASNVIIHDSTYESLTEEQLDKLVGLKGTGLVPTPVDENGAPVADGSQDGLSDGEQYRAIQISWYGIKSTTLVVVPDHANIATDGQNALDAYDAGLTYDQAKNMKNDTNTDGTGVNQYTYALAIDSSGQTYAPSLTNLSTLIPDLNTVTTATQFPANYTFTGTSGNGQALKMNVTLTVPAAGSLSFISAPELMDFGTLKIKNGNLTKFSTNSNSSGTGSTLVVEDTRSGSERTGWNVTASLDNGSLSNGSNNLGKDLYFSKDGSSSVVLNSQAVVIASSSDYSDYPKDISQRDQTYTLDSNWGASSKKGVYLNIPTSDQMAGNYKGTVTWTLNDTPGN